MAENKITEVLDCCRIENCDDCPYRQYYNCREAAMQDAVDLINGQKTEIERLAKVLDVTEALLQSVLNNSLAREDMFQYIEATAIKEFAERLKSLKIKPEFPWDDFYVTETAIDNLVKEMTE